MRSVRTACMVVFAAACGAGAQTIHSVGIAPGGQGSMVTALSADGTVATGYSVMPHGTGFVWSASQGRYDFGFEPGLPFATAPAAISADGRTVVGTSSLGPGAFRWSGPGTYQQIGGIAPATSYGSGVSGDGGIVIGYSEPGPFPGMFGIAFRTTGNGEFQNLGTTRPGNPYTRANAISRDGTSIVGWSTDGGGFSDAYVWTETSGMTILSNLAGRTSSKAWGTSFDGSFVVGTSSGGATRGVYWDEGQVHDLGQPPVGYDVFVPNAVSDDGRVIVGQLAGWQAGIWTSSRGIETLGSYLTAMGVDTTGWYFANCPAVSADGRTLGGSGWEPSGQPVGFVVTVPAPASCIMLIALLRRRRR